MDDVKQVFFPHEWKTKLLPLTDKVTYFIVTKREYEKPIDPYENFEFDGATEIFWTQVDNDVPSEALEKVLRKGILDCDQIYKDAVRTLALSRKKLAEVRKKIANVPYVKFDMKDKEAEQNERLALARYLRSEEVRLTAEIKVQNRTKFEMEMLKLQERIDFTKVNVNEKLNVCDWRIRFGGESGKLRAESVCKKPDWDEYRVFHDTAGKNLIVVKSEPPEDWDRNKEYNLRGSFLNRRMHGQGELRHNNGFDIYSVTHFIFRSKTVFASSLAQKIKVCILQ